MYRLKFPEKLNKVRTMLIGIDVCHAGGNSIVGFAASVNKSMSQFYSDFIVQGKKGTEIVDSEMKGSIRNAIEVFARNNGNKYPQEIIIFRDGVSSAERAMVIQSEVSQFQHACNEMYNQAAEQPKITLVVVNKRIIQSFFVADSNGRLMNPPSGCIIDRDLVECSP